MPAAPADQLRALLSGWREPVFALLDGARFDDVVAEIGTLGLVARPLYLEAGDPRAVASGPHLVALAEAGEIGRMLAWSAGRRSPVFWRWQGGEATLFRHLRTLNLAEIPNLRRVEDADPAYEAVIFRHWDPVVLGQALPLLTPAQAGRFFGAGDAVAFADEDGRARLHERAGGAAASAGLLRFSPAQIEALREVRGDRSQRRIATYLRASAPPEFAATLDEAAAARLARQGRESGRALGLRSERAFGIWTLLILLSDGAVLTEPRVAQAIAESGATPDEAVAEILSVMVAAEAGEGSR